jgi:hypothetical protein
MNHGFFLHDLKRLGSDERNSLESGTDRAVQRPAALRESVFNPAQGLKVFRAK